METPKLKNKTSDTGGLVCGGFNTQKYKGCGKDAGVGVIIRGVVYCLKCGQMLKGVRDERGILKR